MADFMGMPDITEFYMAPETWALTKGWETKYSKRSILYSFGITLLQVLLLSDANSETEICKFQTLIKDIFDPD